MRAAIIGANGAIGRALVARLATDARFEAVHALSRVPGWGDGPVRHGGIDIADPGSIAAAATAIGSPLDLVVITTGLLHERDHGPERSLKDLDPEWLARSFAINAIGPALVLRHFVPLLPRRGRSVIAALSARVGSISDNRAGGWYGYRSAKAALNMIIRCAAIEIARSRPEAICVGLHPGTVDSGLSRPFQANVPAERLFTPAHAAECLFDVLEGLGPEASGRCYAWDRAEVIP